MRRFRKSRKRARWHLSVPCWFVTVVCFPLMPVKWICSGPSFFWRFTHTPTATTTALPRPPLNVRMSPLGLSKRGFLIRAEDSPQDVAHFTQRGVLAHALEDIGHQVLVRPGGGSEGFEGCPNPDVVAPFLQLLELLKLMPRHLLIDHQDFDGALFFSDEIVDADDDFLLALDRLLVGVSRLVDFLLWKPSFDGRHHAAHGVNLVEIVVTRLLSLERTLLDKIRPPERINGAGDAAFVGEYLLGAQGQRHSLLGGQGPGLVKRIGVQRLRPAEDCRERLNGGADHVVVRLLGGERAPSRLCVEPADPGAPVLRSEALAHDARPDVARGAELGDFFK